MRLSAQMSEGHYLIRQLCLRAVPYLSLLGVTPVGSEGTTLRACGSASYTEARTGTALKLPRFVDRTTRIISEVPE